jgi:hypothetical protein
MEKLSTRGKLKDANQRRRFLSRFHLGIKTHCVMQDYANMNALLVVVLEVERILVELGKIPCLSC